MAPVSSNALQLFPSISISLSFDLPTTSLTCRGRSESVPPATQTLPSLKVAAVDQHSIQWRSVQSVHTYNSAHHEKLEELDDFHPLYDFVMFILSVGFHDFLGCNP